MSSTLDDALKSYLELLRSKGCSFETMVNPPTVSQNLVRSRLEAVAGSAPAELISWFSWQNGVATEHSDPSRAIPAMLGGYVPLGLEDSMRKAALLRVGLHIPDSLPNPWVPIASEWARTLVANAETGTIYLFFEWEQNGEVADSITTLLKAWSEFVEAEAIWDDESGLWKTRTAWFNVDRNLAARIGYLA